MALATFDEPQRQSWPLRIGLGFVFVFFAVGGVFHFTHTDLEMRIVPPWIPEPRVAVLVSGVFEFAGAAGLVFLRLRAVALCGLFALVICVTPCHIYMLQYANRFPAIPYWALVLRLPVQAVLLWLIGWLAWRTMRHTKHPIRPWR